jgi:hypothetical protein
MSSDEINEQLEEKKNEYLEKKKSGNVTINIVGTKPKGSESDNSEKSLEEKLEEMTTLKEDYESKLKLVAEQKFTEKKASLSCEDADIDTPEKLLAWAKGAGKESKFSSKGAGGSVSLRPEDLSIEKSGSNQKEFDSHAEMITYLRDKARLNPNSIEASQLKQLWSKCVKGIKEAPQKTLNFDIEGKDCLRKVLDRQNIEWRKKHGYIEKEGE